MGKIFLTSVHCQYLILETTKSTGKYAQHKTLVVWNKDNTAVFLFFWMSFCFSIPDEITVLTKLERLDLANNDISGWVLYMYVHIHNGKLNLFHVTAGAFNQLMYLKYNGTTFLFK